MRNAMDAHSDSQEQHFSTPTTSTMQLPFPSDIQDYSAACAAAQANDGFAASTLLSSRADFERFVPPGSVIDDAAAQRYIEATFKMTSTNRVTIELAQVRLRLMQELADQEDLIYEMEQRYNELVGGNQLGGVLRGWDGLIAPKKSLDTLPKDVRKFYVEASKQKDHAFSFTSVTSKAYATRHDLVQQLHQRITGGHPSTPSSPAAPSLTATAAAAQQQSMTTTVSSVNHQRLQSPITEAPTLSVSAGSRRRVSQEYDDKQRRENPVAYLNTTDPQPHAVDDTIEHRPQLPQGNVRKRSRLGHSYQQSDASGISESHQFERARSSDILNSVTTMMTKQLKEEVVAESLSAKTAVSTTSLGPSVGLSQHNSRPAASKASVSEQNVLVNSQFTLSPPMHHQQSLPSSNSSTKGQECHVPPVVVSAADEASCALSVKRRRQSLSLHQSNAAGPTEKTNIQPQPHLSSQQPRAPRRPSIVSRRRSTGAVTVPSAVSKQLTPDNTPVITVKEKNASTMDPDGKLLSSNKQTAGGGQELSDPASILCGVTSETATSRIYPSSSELSKSDGSRNTLMPNKQQDPTDPAGSSVMESSSEILLGSYGNSDCGVPTAASTLKGSQKRTVKKKQSVPLVGTANVNSGTTRIRQAT